MLSIIFKKKSDWRNALAFIGTDIHNHLLPGIDDGSPDIENSMELYEGLHELGFSDFVFTPHILTDIHPNNRTTISNSYSKLKPCIKEKNEVCKLAFAAEYMVDFEFEKIVAGKDLLSFGKENYILIEMSYLVESPNLKNMVFELLTKGYQPILAHPERYNFLHHKFSFYEELVDAGCHLQINLLSMLGHYGAGARKTAEKLIDKGLVNWLGTDTHHTGHIESLRTLAQDRSILKKLERIKDLYNQKVDLEAAD
ncbi:MAG: histidinol phosphatase [Chitinophagaceae bacterium]|nr:histidinol phosphatase [Chitinophagaceae bacterium]